MRSCTVFCVFRVWLRWFGHLERKSGDDWVLACKNVEVVGRKVGAGAGRLGGNV